MKRRWVIGWGLSALTLPLAAAAPSAPMVRVGNDTYHRYEFRASTFPVSSQEEAAVAVDGEGRITVVWASRRQQEGQYGVFAQRFAPNGVAIGGETALNLWTRSHQMAPAIAVDSKGRAFAVWNSHGQDGHGGAVIGRRFDDSFNGGSEIQLNEQWSGHQMQPVLALDTEGRALVAWTSFDHKTKVISIAARRFDVDGKPLGSEITIDNVRYPAVAFAPDGGFAIAYTKLDGENRPVGVYMQRFDASGARAGDPIDVVAESRTSEIEPVIAAAPDGYILAWLDAESDGSDYGVLARRFAFDGTPLGEATVVNTTREGPQSGPAIAVAADGGYAIAWNATDGSEMGIFAQKFDADGTPAGAEFRVNGHTDGDQAMRSATGTQRLAYLPDGSLACVWNGNADKGDKSAVNVTLLTPEPLDLGEAQQGVTDDMKPAAGERPADAPEPHIPPTFNPEDVDYEAERDVRTRGGDFGFTAVVNSGWTPPDPHLAVGPDHIVVMTNGEIAIFEKDGTRTFVDEIEDSFGFWGSVGATGFVFDPEVLYDELSGRFFAMAAEAFAPGGRSYALIAVSDDSNPNGTWHKYRFDTTSLAGDTFDSPNIGVDTDTLYITGDGFGAGANYSIFVYDKAPLLDGDPPTMSNSFTMATSTQSAGIPPVSFDNPPALYMMEHKESFTGNTEVRLIALQDPFAGSPTITTFDLTVPSYGAPEDPPQMGTSSRPNTFDARFWSVAYRNGSLWGTHHINPDRVLARWYEVRMNGWPDSDKDPELVQSGNIDPGGTVRTFFSSITVDDNGNAAMTFSRSSPSEFISMATAYRLACDPLGTFRPDVIQRSATAGYNGGRWGDYSAVNVDPSDGSFWAHHEYAEGSSWRTWVAQLSTDGCDCDPGCELGDYDGDCDVDIEDLSILLAEFGTTYDLEDLAGLLSQFGSDCNP